MTAVPFTFTAGRVYPFEKLAGLSSEQIRKIPGVGWYTFRLIIRVLHAVGLKPQDFVEFDDSLESLNVSDGLYRILRSAKFRGGRLESISDLIKLDLVAVSGLLTYNGVKALEAELRKRGLAFAPLWPDRTVRDVLPEFAGALGNAGLPAKTQLVNITTDRLEDLTRQAETWKSRGRPALSQAVEDLLLILTMLPGEEAAAE